MIALDWKPNTRKLKQFGVFSLFGFGVIGLLVADQLGCFDGSGTWLPSQIIWIVGAVSFVLAFVRPTLLKPLFLLLSIIAFPIGLVMGNVLLVGIYLGLFLPIGLIMKLVRKDPLHRKWDRSAASYWSNRSAVTSQERYYHQY